MTDSSKEPSKGALRAAIAIKREYRPLTDGEKVLAELIDRETKAGEMADLLRKLANTLALGYSYKSIDELAREAERLLTDLEVKP